QARDHSAVSSQMTGRRVRMLACIPSGARHAGSTVSPHGYRGLTASAFSLPWRSAKVIGKTTLPSYFSV
ncbi:MAG: hypothetical protein KZQ72_01885, partial [Candidatus Thiodiazotropha sp. (ex Cardiolucina cf. quadrata)]|nr:hypothetical protein [Candidatus Thiodiazotropha sp. (ex Cardiolucina cf. quadrata)]